MENLLILLAALGFTTHYISCQSFTQCFFTNPQCPNENVTYWLYTRKTETAPEELSLANESSVINADFIVGRPLIFLLHGYTGDHDYSPNQEIRPELLKNNEFNIISVDYGRLAKSPCYFQAVQNARVVANCTAQLIDYLVANQLFTLDDIHVIGFSLGAQTSGMISTYLQVGRLKQITGLDPAKPLFITANDKYKLDKTDAEFVQVIHTDVSRRGILQRIGHVDFYVNGGINQPGCQNQNNQSVSGCNHQRAPEYYAESINSETMFWGYECRDWYTYMIGWCDSGNNKTIVPMGYPTSNNTRGLFIVNTNADKPFARGKNFASKSILEDNREFDDK